jgi:hypothetical protein
MRTPPFAGLPLFGQERPDEILIVGTNRLPPAHDTADGELDGTFSTRTTIRGGTAPSRSATALRRSRFRE